jgi:hypothetical protein
VRFRVFIERIACSSARHPITLSEVLAVLMVVEVMD